MSIYVHSTLHIEDILNRLVVEGCAILGSESAGISLRDSGGWIVRCVHNMPAELVGSRMTDDDERHAVLAHTTGKPVAVVDAFNDERFNVGHLRKHNIRAVLVIPLILRAQPFGVLFLNYHSAPHEFNEAEVNFAFQIATTASIALDNARMVEDIIRSAKQVESINKLMVGRELRMIELKKEIDKLCRQFGQPTRYGYETE